MTREPSTVFLLGKDYHLGDLLWFTAVLATYRQARGPGQVQVHVPDRPVSRILEANPFIDRLVYGGADPIAAALRQQNGDGLIVHDLRMLPIGLAMMREWRRRLPWLYYRDLWLQPRGQWLATFLGLGHLRDYRPSLCLTDEDRAAARHLPAPYVVLAPHVGAYSLPLVGLLWKRIKGWEPERWIELADRLRREGYAPVTMGAPGQEPIPGTNPVIGLSIRQAAGVIERATALVTVESGLWFVAAALGTPFIITPWWLPRSIDWAAPMQVPHRLVYRDEASVEHVHTLVRTVERHDTN